MHSKITFFLSIGISLHIIIIRRQREHWVAVFNKNGGRLVKAKSNNNLKQGQQEWQ